MMPLRSMRCSSGLPDAFKTIAAVQYALDPWLVGQVPVNGLGHALLEGHRRCPAELALELGSVDGVAAIVAGSIGNEGDQRFAGSAVGQRATLVQQLADRLHDDEV